jgi:hypothetical protein
MKPRWGVVLLAIALVPLGRAMTLTLGDESGAAAATRSPERDDVLARARVFLPASRQPGSPLTRDGDGALSCTYLPKDNHGTTPKFDCRLADGRVVKVKYGGTPEVHTEAAATRLLSQIGLAADDVQIVPRVRCRGCPPSPFRLKQVATWFFAEPLVDYLANARTLRDFEWVAVEQKFDAQSIDEPIEGWQWAELERVDAAKGGATRAELDALRLVAVVLADWDNKSENQRLVCLDRGAARNSAARCERPLLMLQDLGGTFGPTKLDIAHWRATPIWKDAAACTTTMESLPYHGGTFVTAQISEAGRALLAARLAALGDDTLRAIFTAARFPDPTTGAPGDVSAWIQVFDEKRAAIANRAPCPSLP